MESWSIFCLKTLQHNYLSEPYKKLWVCPGSIHVRTTINVLIFFYLDEVDYQIFHCNPWFEPSYILSISYPALSHILDKVRGQIAARFPHQLLGPYYSVVPFIALLSIFNFSILQITRSQRKDVVARLRIFYLTCK